MKSIALSAAGITALAAGCASAPYPPTSAYDNIDTQKVAVVNEAARARGITVLWVRFPEQKRPPADVVPSLGEPSGT